MKRLFDPLLRLTDMGTRRWPLWGVLLAALIFYYPSTLGSDYDTWFHLAYGMHYVENLALSIDHSVYSWTPAVSHYGYVTWLGSSAIYLVFRAFGLWGLYALLWACLLGVCLLFIVHTRRLGNPPDPVDAFILLISLMAICPAANYLKLEMFSILFFSFVVAAYVWTKASRRPFVLLYPPLFLLWVNVHGLFIAGIVFVGLALAGEAVLSVFRGRDRMPGGLLLRFAAALALSCVAVLFNPEGYRYPLQIMAEFSSPESFSQVTRESLYAYQGMWGFLRPAFLMTRLGSSAWLMVIMAAAYSAVALYGLVKGRYFDPPLLGVNAVFFLLGMQVSRALLFFPLIWCFTLGFALKKAGLLDLKRAFFPAAVALILLAAASSAFISFSYGEDVVLDGVEVEEAVPVNETRFILEHGVPGPLFNDYLTGGYMLWALYPRYKVFIDPRFFPYTGQVLMDWAELMEDPSSDGVRRLSSRYPFRSALLHLQNRSLILSMLETGQWALVYFDRVAAVLVRRDALGLLPREAMDADIGPGRFREVRNPAVLARLFELYMVVEPSLAPHILHIYEDGVSDFYRYKELTVREMRAASGR